jgi:hypothetical protein
VSELSHWTSELLKPRVASPSASIATTQASSTTTTKTASVPENTTDASTTAPITIAPDSTLGAVKLKYELWSGVEQFFVIFLVSHFILFLLLFIVVWGDIFCDLLPS